MLNLSHDQAAGWDAADPLAALRDQFYLPNDANVHLYLDGNSLGLLSRPAEASLLAALESWKTQAIAGWTHGAPAPWFSFAETLAEKIAPLVGAHGPDEVIVSGTTTANLHQLLATLFRPAGLRTKIVTDALNFPSDRYALASHLRLRGLDPADHLVVVPSRDGRTLREEDLIEAMSAPDVVLAVFPSVLYASGQLLDMERLTDCARRQGVLIGWDCSHSIGAVPHALSDWGADFAVWCHYKYLNAGPGAVGGLYVNRRHHAVNGGACAAPGLAGWFGSEKARQFDMTDALAPAGDAGALQIGTPSILGMAPLAGALELHHRAGIERLREKSLRLTAYLRALVEARLSRFGVWVATPRANERRGGHLALVHPDADRLCRALRENGVVPDFRAPDVIRLAPVPLYNRFVDCFDAVARLETILVEKRHERLSAGREVVS